MSAGGSVIQAVHLGFGLLFGAGVTVVLVDARAGVFLLLGGFIGQVGMHLVVGVVQYRRTMRRPWPNVPPLDDDW